MESADSTRQRSLASNGTNHGTGIIQLLDRIPGLTRAPEARHSWYLRTVRLVSAPETNASLTGRGVLLTNFSKARHERNRVCHGHTYSRSFTRRR